MQVRVSRVLIIANLSKPRAEDSVNEVRAFLENRGISVCTNLYRERPAAPPTVDCDLAFSLGGDGTVLYSARLLAPYGIPVMAVTAFALKGDREEILAGGCDYYVSKPIIVPEFMKMLGEILS